MKKNRRLPGLLFAVSTVSCQQQWLTKVAACLPQSLNGTNKHQAN
jgi:hypothetical protein